MTHVRRSRPEADAVRRADTCILTLGFVGFLPWVGGGIAAGLSLPFAVFLAPALPAMLPLRLLVFVSLLVMLTVIGVRVLSSHVRDGMYDRAYVVLDEFIGMSVALTPYYLGIDVPYGFVIPFILFGVLDVFKPFGLRRIDRWNHPLAVFLDDIMAGIYVAVCVSVYVILLT